MSSSIPSRPGSPMDVDSSISQAASSLPMPAASPAELRDRCMEAFMQMQRALAAAASSASSPVAASSSPHSPLYSAQSRDVSSSSMERPGGSSSAAVPPFAAAASSSSSAAAASSSGPKPRNFGQKEMNLCKYSSISDFIDALRRAPPSSIRSIDLREFEYLEEEKLTEILNLCRGLEGFFFGDYEISLTESHLTVLGTGNPDLRHLNLEDSEVSPSHLQLIGKYFSKLEFLNLSGCYGDKISSQGFTPLEGKCLLLNRIDIERNPTVQNEHAIPLLRGRLRLLTLNLGGTSIDSGILRPIQDNCPHVRELGLNRTDIQGFAFADAAFPELREVDISECEDVTIENLAAFIGNCPQLRRIISSFEEEELARLNEIYPNLIFDEE